MNDLEKCVSAFRELMKIQLERVEVIKVGQEWIDYGSKSPLVIGVCWGDGIGESISKQAQRVLEHVLKDVVESGKIEFRSIEGLTIENRAKHKQAIPDDVLAESTAGAD